VVDRMCSFLVFHWWGSLSQYYVIYLEETEFAQIERIYEICGDFQSNDVSEESIKNYSNYADFKPKKPYRKDLVNYLKKFCPLMTPTAIDLMERLLHLDPNRRLSC
jgi:hypothetical protein